MTTTRIPATEVHVNDVLRIAGKNASVFRVDHYTDGVIGIGYYHNAATRGTYSMAVYPDVKLSRVDA